MQLNGDSSNTELLFRIIHFVNQLSIYGAVANWCEQFGLTEEDEKKWDLWTKVNWQVWSRTKFSFLVSRPKMAFRNSLQEKNILNFEALSDKKFLQAMWTWTSCISRDDVENSSWRRLWATCSMSRIHTFSSNTPIPSLCSNSWVNSYRENSWTTWTWNCNSMASQSWERTYHVVISRGKNRFVGWSSRSQRRTQTQHRINLSQHFRN